MHSNPIRCPHDRRATPAPPAGFEAAHADWLAGGEPWSAEHGVVDSRDLADALPRPPRVLRPMTLGEFMARPTPPRRLLLAPILPAQGIAMLYGPRVERTESPPSSGPLHGRENSQSNAAQARWMRAHASSSVASSTA